jgi:hypothetical protein
MRRVAGGDEDGRPAVQLTKRCGTCIVQHVSKNTEQVLKTSKCMTADEASEKMTRDLTCSNVMRRACEMKLKQNFVLLQTDQHLSVLFQFYFTVHAS